MASPVFSSYAMILIYFYKEDLIWENQGISVSGKLCVKAKGLSHSDF